MYVFSRSGLVIIGEWGRVVSFASFGVNVDVVVLGECVIIFQSKILRHTCKVHPFCIYHNQLQNRSSNKGSGFMLEGLGFGV